MNYPVIPRDKKRNIKMTQENIDIALSSKKLGISVIEIADKLNVTTQTIYYYISPQYHQTAITNARNYRKRNLEDEDYRKKAVEGMKRWQKFHSDNKTDTYKWLRKERKKHKKFLPKVTSLQRRIKFRQFWHLIEDHKSIDVDTIRGKRTKCTVCNKYLSKSLVKK